MATPFSPSDHGVHRPLPAEESLQCCRRADGRIVVSLRRGEQVLTLDLTPQAAAHFSGLLLAACKGEAA